MNWNSQLKTTKLMAMEFDPDPDHALHVCYLSLLIFKHLEPVHRLSQSTNCHLTPNQLLHLAALLHDVGWSKGGAGGHHRKSRDIILSASQLDLFHADRTLIAQIARYHRKSHPNPLRDFAYAELTIDEQNCVQWLAGILRIADGLDRAHTSDVDNLSCTVTPKIITITIECRSGASAAIHGASRKKELLEEMSHRHVEITA